MASAPLVVSLDSDDVSLERAVLQSLVPGARIEALDLKTQAEAMVHPLLPLADVVLMWHTLVLDDALVQRLPRARAIVRVGVGYDNIELPAVTAVGLPVRMRIGALLACGEQEAAKYAQLGNATGVQVDGRM